MTLQRKLQIAALLLICSLIAALYFVGIALRNEKIDKARIVNNLAIVSGQKAAAEMQVQTVKEYSKSQTAKNDSILKLLKIKPKDIQYQVEIQDNKVDTNRHIAPLKPAEPIKIHDTLFVAKQFEFNEPCYYIKGFTALNFAGITEYKNKDKITIFLTKDYNHRFLFFRWDMFMVAKAYSQCNNDTISVMRYLHVVKNQSAWVSETLK